MYPSHNIGANFTLTFKFVCIYIAHYHFYPRDNVSFNKNDDVKLLLLKTDDNL